VPWQNFGMQCQCWQECGANLQIVRSKTLIKGKMLSGGTVYLLLMGIS